MNGPYAPLDRLEARLEQLTARVDELTRLVEQREGAKPAPADQTRPGAHELTGRKRRRHRAHASRV